MFFFFWRTGVGVAMVTVSLIVCIYYNVIMSYTIYYMYASISEVVPWSICDPAWANMTTCYVRSMGVNKTVSAHFAGEFIQLLRRKKYLYFAHIV